MAGKKAETQGNAETQEKPQGPSCRLCGKVPEYPNFECPSRPGKHELPLKTYYHGGATHLHPVSARRNFRPTLVLKQAVERMDNLQQRAVHESGLDVTMPMGRYTTTNAEEQFYLDRHPEVKSGEEGLAMWRSIYLETSQQKDIAEKELEEVNRQLRESKSLLDRVKETSGAPAA